MSYRLSYSQTQNCKEKEGGNGWSPVIHIEDLFIVFSVSIKNMRHNRIKEEEDIKEGISGLLNFFVNLLSNCI